MHFTSIKQIPKCHSIKDKSCNKNRPPPKKKMCLNKMSSAAS